MSNQQWVPRVLAPVCFDGEQVKNTAWRMDDMNEGCSRKGGKKRRNLSCKGECTDAGARNTKLQRKKITGQKRDTAVATATRNVKGATSNGGGKIRSIAKMKGQNGGEMYLNV